MFRGIKYLLNAISGEILTFGLCSEKESSIGDMNPNTSILGFRLVTGIGGFHFQISLSFVIDFGLLLIDDKNIVVLVSIVSSKHTFPIRGRCHNASCYCMTLRLLLYYTRQVEFSLQRIILHILLSLNH